MFKQKLLLILISVFALAKSLFAQITKENTGWLALFNNYKISTHWSLLFDVQVRTADDWDYVRTVILRPAAIYNFNAKNNVMTGYALVKTYNRFEGNNTSLTEHRIWEQYINNQKFKQVSLQNRFRLEQRFINRASGKVFAQRFRYFVRTIIPLAKQKSEFSNGVYGALQNEVFLNVQNKDKLNNSVFDQNRVYGAIGYRFTAKFDTEVGYMNQYTNGATANTSNNIIQLALYTRL